MAESPPQKQPDDDRNWFREFDIQKVKGDEPSPTTSERGNPSGEKPNAILAYETLKQKAMEIRERVKKDQVLDPLGILSDLRYIMENQLLEDIYEYTMMATRDFEQILSQTLDVTIVSLKLGKGMAYENRQLLNLGLAACLENVGMYTIPESIIAKKGALDDREMALIKGHPEASSRILSSLGPEFQWVGDIALQVHERRDGSGYPRGLKGEEVDEWASIIGLADTYMAMIKRRPYRDRFLPTDAVKLLVKEAKILFPERVLKAFLDHISLFPLNTLVRLNNDTIGRVIATDPGQPLRPTIELLQDGRGVHLGDRKVIRLADHPLFSIVEAVDESSLSGH